MNQILSMPGQPFKSHWPLSLTWVSISVRKLISENAVNIVIIFSNLKNAIFYVHIWNLYGKCIRMSTNMPMFGPVVLEMDCDIFSLVFSSLQHNRVFIFYAAYSINYLLTNLHRWGSMYCSMVDNIMLEWCLKLAHYIIIH